MKEEDSRLCSTVRRTRQQVPLAICYFNLIEKHVRGNTVVPSDANKLTSQVINDGLNSPLRETPDQPFVGSDLARGATPHADLVLVEHFRTPPSKQPTPSRQQLSAT